ncbi:MAG: metallophosphoesterase [Clostridiales bacterium]|nr:metallophosphoesterase [Clostridiales bacterium]MCC8104998.1 metallophosphoesterase [Clostridiales bacterium]
MKILIVSDTHGYDDNLKKALEQTGQPDCMIHLGDSEGSEEHMRSLANCPVYMVAGNCDYFTRLPVSRVVDLDDCRVFMTHGHYYYVSVGVRDLAEEAKTNSCNVAMFGHTHRPFIDEGDPALTILNPGSLSFPRQEGRKPSYIVMETAAGQRPVYRLCFLEKN